MPTSSHPRTRRQRLRLRPEAGRPSLPPDAARTRRLHLNFTEYEDQLLAARARSAGVPPYHLARCLALYGTLPVSQVPAVNYACVAQLARIGSLLNQAVHRLHTGELPDDFREVLANLEQQLRLTRIALVTPPDESSEENAP
jgi:hypothetical protein